MNLKRKIYEFIVDQETRWKCLPTQSDIRKLFSGLSDDVGLHLEQLEREGLLTLDKTGKDKIVLLPTFAPASIIKVRGGIPFGEANEDRAMFDRSIVLDLRGIGLPVEPDAWAIQIFDESMTDAGIEYGDISVLVNAPPERGDIVGVEEDGRTVLRRYLIISGIPHLLAENPTRPDLRVAYESITSGVVRVVLRTKCGRGTVDGGARKSLRYSAPVSVGSPVPAMPTFSARSQTARKPVPLTRAPVARRRKSRALKKPLLPPDGWPGPPACSGLNEPAGSGYSARTREL